MLSQNMRMPLAPSPPRARYPPFRNDTMDSGLYDSQDERSYLGQRQRYGDAPQQSSRRFLSSDEELVESPEEEDDFDTPRSRGLVNLLSSQPNLTARGQGMRYEETTEEEDAIELSRRTAAARLKHYLSLPPSSIDDGLPAISEREYRVSERNRMASEDPRPDSDQRQAGASGAQRNDPRRPERGFSGLVKKAVRGMTLDGGPRSIPSRSNDVSSLARGIICSTHRKRELTILLVGETGVGKTSVLTWFANMLRGSLPDDYNLDVPDASNETGGAAKNSQTNAARVYKLESVNGFTVTILDTPGLADTRGIAQDEKHKKSIGDAIKNDIPVIDAVLILANGTVPRLNVSTNYALTTLASIFPRTIVNNIGVLMTNVPNALNCNFDTESLPNSLSKAPLFMVDNPVCLESKFRKQQWPSRMREKVHRDVQNGHDKALDIFVDLLDWLDECALQPTREIVSLYEQTSQIEKNISEALALLKQAQNKQTELAECMDLIERGKVDLVMFKKIQETISSQVWVQRTTNKKNIICTVPDCYQNCHISCNMQFSFHRYRYKLCSTFGHGRSSHCRVCGHHYSTHSHLKSLWEQEERVGVSPEAKQRIENANSEQEQREHLRDQVTREIEAMKINMRVGMDRIRELVESYSGLALSGNFSVHIEKSVDMLVMARETLSNEGGDEMTILSLGETIGRLQEKLQVVRDACKQRGKRA